MKRILTTALALITVGCGTGSGNGWTKPADPERITKPSVPPGDMAALVTGNTAFGPRCTSSWPRRAATCSTRPTASP